MGSSLVLCNPLIMVHEHGICVCSVSITVESPFRCDGGYRTACELEDGTLVGRDPQLEDCTLSKHEPIGPSGTDAQPLTWSPPSHAYAILPPLSHLNSRTAHLHVHRQQHANSPYTTRD